MQNAQVNERVVVDGTAFDVNGKNVSMASTGEPVEGEAALPALRLAYAKVAAERSPLMALPNIDIASFNTDISDLSDTESMLAGIQSTTSDKVAVGSSLYPISFLQAASATEAARLAFIASGSDTDEAAYERAQMEAVNAYQSDIASFKSSFQEIVPASTDEYADATYVITRAGILNELQSLAEGNETVSSVLQSRDACIAGKFDECDPSALQFATTTAPAPQQISPSQEQLADQVFSIWKKLSVPGAYTTQQIDLSQSACADELGGADRFVLVLSGTTVEKLTYLGDIRFVKASDESETAFGTFMASRGITYVYDSPLSHYTCSALDDDLADIFSVWDISNFARTTPMSRYATGSQAVQLRTLEAKLGSGTTIDESDAVTYLIDAMQASTTAPSAMTQQLNSLYLERFDGDAGLPRFVQNIAWIESANVQLYHQHVPIALDAEYLFYIRSAFLGLFLSNDPSVVGPQPQPFPLDTVPIAQQPYVLFSQLDAAQQAKATSDLYSFIQLHVDAASQVDF